MEQGKLKFKTLKKRKTKLKLKKNEDKKEEEAVVDYGDNIVTYTWCECGENHHGNQQIGQIADSGQGFMRADLIAAKTFAEENYNCDTEMFNLKDGLINDAGEPLIIKNKKDEIVNVNSAHFLLIRGFIPAILNKYGFSMNDLMKEVMGQKWDNKYWDTRRQKVLNKHARENNVVSEMDQEANYEEGKGTIHAFKNIPI